MARLWIERTSKQPLLNLRMMFRRNFGFGIVAHIACSASHSTLGIHLPVYLCGSRATCRAVGWCSPGPDAETGLLPIVPRMMKRFDPHS